MSTISSPYQRVTTLFSLIRTHRASSRNLVSTKVMHSSTCDSIFIKEDIVLFTILSINIPFCPVRGRTHSRKSVGAEIGVNIL